MLCVYRGSYAFSKQVEKGTNHESFDGKKVAALSLYGRLRRSNRGGNTKLLVREKSLWRGIHSGPRDRALPQFKVWNTWRGNDAPEDEEAESIVVCTSLWGWCPRKKSSANTHTLERAKKKYVVPGWRKIRSVWEIVTCAQMSERKFSHNHWKKLLKNEKYM